MMQEESKPRKRSDYRSARAGDAERAFEAERERMHRQMLSSVSHDLKTPLAAVIGSLEIYGRMKHILTPAKAEELIATALEEAYRLDNFVTNILDMAKLDNGMLRPRLQDCDLEALLRECVEKAEHRFPLSRVRMDLDVRGVSLQTDPALLARAIGLVIDNALRYGGRPPAAVLHVRESADEAGFIEIDVEDGGPGIPAGRREDIFSKYTRIKQGDLQNAGTGLGLTISRGLTELLGGTLHAREPLHGGALFTFVLPLSI